MVFINYLSNIFDSYLNLFFFYYDCFTLEWIEIELEKYYTYKLYSTMFYFMLMLVMYLIQYRILCTRLG